MYRQWMHRAFTMMALTLFAAVMPIVFQSIATPTTAVSVRAASTIDSWMPNKKLQTLVWYALNEQYQAEGKAALASPEDITQNDLGQLKELVWEPRNHQSDSTYTHLSTTNGGNGAIGPVNPGNYSLAGLQYATSLTKLGLGQDLMFDHLFFRGDITDLTPLKGLTNLTWIDLSGNRISDVTPIAGLKNVTYLQLGYNSIPDLSALNAAQYTDFLGYQGQSVVLPKVNLKGDSYTFKAPFKDKLPQGTVWTQPVVSSITSNHGVWGEKADAYSPTHALQAFWSYTQSVAPTITNPSSLATDVTYNGLVPQIRPGSTQNPWASQFPGSTIIPNEVNFFMNISATDEKIYGTNPVFRYYLPYDTNVADVTYRIIPYDRATGEPIPNYTPVEKTATPGDLVEVPTIAGYVPETNQVTVPDGGGDIKAWYNKPAPTQIEYTGKFVDESGQEIRPAVTGTVAEGTTLTAPEIDGYDHVGQTTDTVTKDHTTITFVYKLKTPSVTPPIAPPTNPEDPIPGQPDNPGHAVKGEAVYALQKIYLYQNKTFKQSERKAVYAKKARVYRPMFVVKDYTVSKNGVARYYVKDVNHHSSSAGKTGYITANKAYVTPVYHRAKAKTITVINPTGANEYRTKGLTGQVNHLKQGTVLKVKAIVTHHLTTRYQLTNGHYVTANKKFIKVGVAQQPKTIKAKHTINLYKTVNLTGKRHSIKRGTVLTVKRYDYSHTDNTARGGVLRYQVSGGYVTGNRGLVTVVK